jgi:hypothetical protein
MAEKTEKKAATKEAAVKTSKARAESKCSKEGCKRPYRAKGYCNVHYRLWRHAAEGFKKTRYKICTKEGCKKPRVKTGGSACAEHASGEAAAAS